VKAWVWVTWSGPGTWQGFTSIGWVHLTDVSSIGERFLGRLPSLFCVGDPDLEAGMAEF